jgi:hypothetical protein
MEEKEKDELQELRDLLEKEKARADKNEEDLKKERAARVADAKKYVFGNAKNEDENENENDVDEDDDEVMQSAKRIAEKINKPYQKK